MAATYDESVINKIGEIYGRMPESTRDQIIGDFVSGAIAWTAGYTGASSGGNLIFDEVVTDRAAWRSVVWMGGGNAAGFGYTLGKMSVGNDRNASDNILNMANLLHNSMKEGLVVLGKKIRYDKVND